MNAAWWKNALPHAGKADAGKRPTQDRWWDTSSDEALFWPEKEHEARVRRMQQLGRSLDTLRGIRPRSRYSD
ncbi:MAG TPA: hypothetical protein VJV39_13595 [Dongiaceae bacterium]|nr:hypothetical protein [Dongiaceae bacterium]